MTMFNRTAVLNILAAMAGLTTRSDVPALPSPTQRGPLQRQRVNYRPSCNKFAGRPIIHAEPNTGASLDEDARIRRAIAKRIRKAAR